MTKKTGRHYKYGRDNPVVQISIYVPEKTLDRLPDSYHGRNDWILDAIEKKINEKK
jgi:hypothetical protein